MNSAVVLLSLTDGCKAELIWVQSSESLHAVVSASNGYDAQCIPSREASVDND
jgi:hypothetical protein